MVEILANKYLKTTAYDSVELEVEDDGAWFLNYYKGEDFHTTEIPRNGYYAYYLEGTPIR